MKSVQAQAAAAIRAELKREWPSVKFTVRSSSASMMTAVRISWVDGPTEDDVQAITAKYEYGRFDAMTDMYEMTNTRKDIPQVKYVSAQRRYSPQVVKWATAKIESAHEGADEDTIARLFPYGIEDEVYRELRDTKLEAV